MASNTPLAGTVYFSVDGAPYNPSGEFTYDPSSITRESLIGMAGVDGFSEKFKSPVIKGKIRDNGNLTVGLFNLMRNNTVTLVLVNGKTVTGRNMWTVEPTEVNTEDGTFEVTWNGAAGAVTEQTASA